MLYFSVVLLNQNVENDPRDGQYEDTTPSFQRFPESSSRTSLTPSTSGSKLHNADRCRPPPYTNSSDDSTFSESPSPPPAMEVEGRNRTFSAPTPSRRSNVHLKSGSESLRGRSLPRRASPDRMSDEGSSSSSATGSERSMSATPPPSASFSKVVMTKFSHPPGYRAKKVKFHPCPECGKAFPRPSGLRTHMNTHTKAKPYPCTFEGCDKTFSVISNAKRHYRTHLTGPAPDPFGSSGPFIVDFSEPVVLDAIPPPSTCGSEGGGGRASPSTSISSSSDSVSPPPPHGRNETPVSLRWLPPGADTRRSLYTPLCPKRTGAPRS